jgi:pimeloyl-ACP methyl ester carboxylesterase
MKAEIMKGLSGMLLLAGLLVLAPPDRAQGGITGQFEAAPCPMDVPKGKTEGVDLTCGYVTVPEDHATPGGKTIELAIVILSSNRADPARDPWLMLEGGPGTSAISTFVPLMASPFGEPFLAKRDVVVLEQRGTYYSRPALFCAADETLAACHDRLVAEGVDLQAYSIANNAADVAMVMEALGYDRYNLYGVSFGTMLAQYVMRDYPERLRSVILDSVLPIGLDPTVHGNAAELGASSRLLALDQLLADCAADPACNRFHPDLEAEIYDAIVRFNATPAVLSFEDPETGKPFEVTVTGEDLLEGMFDLLYSQQAEQIPIFLELLTEGDLYLVFSADMFLPGGEPMWCAGLHNVMNCSALAAVMPVDLDVEGLEALILEEWNATAKGFNAARDLWGIRNPDFGAIPPAASDIPTLLLSGELDPNTPPRNATIVAEGLSHGTAIAFPGLGHQIVASHSCPRSIALAFLDDPTSLPDTSCVQNMRSRFISEPIAGRLLLLQEEPPLLRLALLLGILLLMLSGIAAWLVGAVRSRGRQDERGNRARWWAGAAAGLNIVFVLIFVACNPMEVIYGYPLVLRLGMLLPLISMIPAVASLVHAGLAWRDGYWGIAGRVHYTLVGLAIVVFLWQLSYWHLLGWRL